MAKRKAFDPDSFVPHPQPAHVRTEEWNGMTRGQLVQVKVVGRKGASYVFHSFAVSPSGIEYVDVIEQQAPNRQSPGPRLYRSVRPEYVMPFPVRRKRRKDT